MARKLSKAKRQVLFNFLPGRTFDFSKTGAIARVTRIRGYERRDLNLGVVLRKVSDAARAWPVDERPVLRDDVLADPSRFFLLDPKTLEAELFPRVFWCNNNACGAIYDLSGSEDLPAKTCKRCKTGTLVQLRFVKIHRCGALEPLQPFSCPRCHTPKHMSLETRG